MKAWVCFWIVCGALGLCVGWLAGTAVQLGERPTETESQQQLEAALKRGCYTAARAPAAERCIYAGLRGTK